ncbi:uncharacterized zinc finger CCHC domain-containing protein At4g19190 [Humulus lupulus]|uniref:uncharacterized zinc finger CCHC domain-containing protein At4g19190 n=1 Tax=Humulus lupulus TaxID=3486 RepID=UPI002B408D48|nr:uncharacterized zinc finger CCHC domain-containing protein At4g19190 [Humulus lupulus]
MEGEEGEGIRLSKRFSSETSKGGEVDYKTKSGTAWSHSYLNQKPWHPLSYPNQRRKWIAEQTHANHERRAEEVAREYAQEQEFFRQAAMVSKKEQEKLEIMKAVSFMYVRPPGYNAESAKAAEIAEERKLEEQSNPNVDGPSTSMPSESIPGKGQLAEEKKKRRPKDVFGRSLPTGEEFEILKNAPRMETGVAGRAKPFGVEIRNVKCVRCGTFGHQSGDRECPLKDVIMPNEQSRLKRDDPLTAILAHIDPSEPLKWELKQKPGISPPRGGFKLDDPNQQIVAEDIFDEYGGFLSGGIPELLINFPGKPKDKSRKKNKHKNKKLSPNIEELEENEFSCTSEDEERRLKKQKHTKSKKSKKRRTHYETSTSEVSEYDEHNEKSNHRDFHTSEESDGSQHHHSSTKIKSRRKHSHENSVDYRHRRIDRNLRKKPLVSEESDSDRHHNSRHKHSYDSSEDSDGQYRSKDKHKRSYSHQDSDTERQQRSGKHKHRRDHLNSDQRRHHHRQRHHHHRP